MRRTKVVDIMIDVDSYFVDIQIGSCAEMLNEC